MRIEIDDGYLLAQLERLLRIPSPTGYTDSIVHHVADELEHLGVDVELTRRGEIRSRLRGEETRPARAIVSHLDTLGAMVKRLKDNGRLELVPIGHWSARFAEGARCTLFSDERVFRGSILPLKASGHTFNVEVDTQPVGWAHVELRVDVRADGRDDLARHGIQVGDIVAIDPQPEFLENGYIVSRHLDDKAGVALMLASLEAVLRSGLRPAVDTYWMFTISEEVGVGAASILLPEIASLVAVDNGTTAPGQESREVGVTIAMGDETGPFDYHLTRKLIGLAKAHGIPMQRDVFRYYRSDLASALTAGNDIRTALLAFGIDASHGYERITIGALSSVAALIAAYVASPVLIGRDARPIGPPKDFTSQPEGPPPS
jgi:peptidase M42 family hydrolase